MNEDDADKTIGRLDQTDIDKIASAMHESIKSSLEFHVKLLIGEYVGPALRRALLEDTVVHNEMVMAIREEARELLAAKTAAPNGPLVSRAALREAIDAARFSDTETDRLDCVCESLRKSGYFVL